MHIHTVRAVRGGWTHTVTIRDTVCLSPQTMIDEPLMCNSANRVLRVFLSVVTVLIITSSRPIGQTD